MKKVDYDLTVEVIHVDGLPNYTKGEAVQFVTDSARGNILMHDRNYQRMIILPYKQITSAANGEIKSPDAAGKTAVGFAVGGITGAMIGAAASTPASNLLSIAYTSSAGEPRTIVLSSSPTFKDMADLAAVINSHIPRNIPTAPTYL